jgi:hypothetical protein
MRTLTFCLAIVVLSPLATAAAAVPISNEAFAGKVRTLRQQMAGDAAAVARAEVLCSHLPPHRAADEPACLALRLHQRAAVAEATAGGNGLVGPMLERALRSVVTAMSRTDA